MDPSAPNEPNPGSDPGSSRQGPLLAIGVTLMILGAIIAILSTLPSEEDLSRPRSTPDPVVPTDPPAEPPADEGAAPEPEKIDSSASSIPSSLLPAPPDPTRLVSFEGRVSSPSGELLAGVTVLSGRIDSRYQRQATSDEKGKFAIELSADESPVVRMSAPGYYRQVVELERDRDRDLPYLLFRGGRIHGKVTAPIYRDGEMQMEPAPAVVLDFAGREGWADTITTDREGSYSLTAPFGPVVIHARSPRYRDQQILDVESLRTQDVTHNIQMSLGVQLDVIPFGTQANGEKSVISDAHIRVFTDMGLEGDLVSGATGKGSFPGLTPGRGRIVVVRSGYRAETFSVTLNEEPALVRHPVHLDPSTPWTLEVVDRDGKPRPDAEVSISFQRIELVNTEAGNVGALDILGRDRRYRVEISAADAPRTQRRFRIPSSGPAKLRVVLAKGGRFTGRAVDDRGRPIPGAGILIAPTGGPDAEQGPPRVARTSLDGTFRTELLAPGPYRIQVHHARLGRTTIETRIVDGEDRAVGDMKLEANR